MGETFRGLAGHGGGMEISGWKGQRCCWLGNAIRMAATGLDMKKEKNIERSLEGLAGHAGDGNELWKGWR